MSMMNIRPTLATAIVGLAALAGIAEPACADFYQFTFGGEIHTVDGFVPEPWEDVHVGSEFELTYVFDSETPDQVPINWIGVYDVMWAEVTIDGAPQFTEDSTIVIMDEGLDRYSVQFRDLPVGADGVINLVGWDVIESDDLLLDINLADWTTVQAFKLGGAGFEVYGHVDSFGSQIVPAPAGLPCIFVVVLLRGRRRRGSRNTN